MRVSALLLVLCSLSLAGGAGAAETVSIGGSRAVLLKPAQPRASVILMAGGDGEIRPGPNGTIGRLQNNELVRTRGAYAARGLAVLVVDADVNLAAAVNHMRAIKPPVTVIATSRGTLRAARGIAKGARPDSMVLSSGFLSDASGSRENVVNILRTPERLPHTLVIEHRHDSCHNTLPAGVAPFVQWAGGRARAAWLDGGTASGDPCKARAHHGFAGLDGQVVSLAAGFR